MHSCAAHPGPSEVSGTMNSDLSVQRWHKANGVRRKVRGERWVRRGGALQRAERWVTHAVQRGQGLQRSLHRSMGESSICEKGTRGDKGGKAQKWRQWTGHLCGWVGTWLMGSGCLGPLRASYWGH